MTGAETASLVTALGARCAAAGFDVLGAAPVAAYDALVGPAHALAPSYSAFPTALVVGNGGGALWRAFRRHVAAHPGEGALPDPVDSYTRREVDAAVAATLGAAAIPHRVLYAFRFPDDPVSFRRLGEAAGLGSPSLLGLLVHPVYGPWMALRAAVLVPFAVDLDRPAAGFDPCPACVERACMPACPAGAVDGGGWDVPRCAAHRARPEDACAPRCHARFDCVVGRAHRYPHEALAYHQARARGPLVASARGSGEPVE
jgi:hypothetical protein